MDDAWLSKDEVNSLYYNAVAGQIDFATEAEGGAHSTAAARLVARVADSLGRRQIRVLEIGANNCIFARKFLLELWTARGAGSTRLERIDYLAVEYARAALEAAAEREERQGVFDRVAIGPAAAFGSAGPPEQPSLVALITAADEVAINLGLVHAEANQFVRANREPFDFVILNELLDDMPWRAFFADGDGRAFEAVAACRADGGRWTVRIGAEPLTGAEGLDVPPGMLTARSPACVELVDRVADLLVPGGMLLVHDYGFTERFNAVETYEPLPPSLPAFAELVYPVGSEEGFPRGFFRVFGNDEKKVIQITNDVGFADLVDVLTPSGAVTTIPHGNSILTRGGTLQRGDGVFLSEFGLLEPGDDVAALLAQLQGDQGRIRQEFADRFTGGRASLFLDLLYVKR